MRVLHLDAGREMRGGQWQVLRLVEGLQPPQGVECTLLARDGAPLFQAARAKGWRVEPLGLSRTTSAGRASHDLVHAHDARSHTAALLLRRIPWWSRDAWRSRCALAGNTAGPRHYLAVSRVRGGGTPGARECRGRKSRWFRMACRCCRFRAVPGAIWHPANEARPLPGLECKLATDLERDLCDASVFVYITQRGPGLRRVDGDVGGRSGGGEQQSADCPK